MPTTTWDLMGNTGNTPSAFLGTTDTQPVVVKTANTERLRIDKDGNVGVGTTSPGATLGVVSGTAAPALSATCNQAVAIRSQSQKDTAVFATSDAGMGVDARSNSNIGVQALSQTNTGLFAMSTSGVGVDARSAQGIAVRAQAQSDTAVFATSNAGRGVDARSSTGVGVYGEGGKYAAYFQGDVVVTGDVVLVGADCAERFDVAADEPCPEAGTVVVIDHEGRLKESRDAYDRKVAGVVSGAGCYRPAIVLDHRVSETNRSENRVPVALVGKVYCKVDAQYAAIEIGDLLTSSPTSGHAMKATESPRAFGAILGKALRPLARGTGLIPVLVALQ